MGDGLTRTVFSLGLLFVAQPAWGEKHFKAETEGPAGPVGEEHGTHI